MAAYTAEHGGVLHAKKYTEYSRVILAWTALGKDATDVGGFNLLVPLADFDQTVFQGINGPIFALLALDSGAYDIPENTAGTTQATRDGYVDYILNAELPGGGWSFAGGDAETDITAMALQALAKYRDRQDVADAVERGLTVLSQQQEENGGFVAYDSESSESIAQVIVALTELDVSLTDSRFVNAVLQLAEFFLLVSADCVLPYFRLFLCGEFHNVVHCHLALNGLAHLYLVLVIVVDGLPEYLPVREAVATAPLHVVENVGDAIVYVLGRVAVVPRKECIFRCTLLQIHLYRSLEMFCSFHIAVVFRLSVSVSLSNRSAQPRSKGSL